MDKSKINEMEELDARIENINFDLAGLNTRKQEMENKKFELQKEIDELEKNKNKILSKTTAMGKFQRAMYIIFSSRNDLKEVDLINAQIEEKIKERDKTQNKIDTQNKIYVDKVNEKDTYIEQRKELYIANNEHNKNKEKIKASEMEGLTKIYEITKQYGNNKIMQEINNTVGKQIGTFLNYTNKTKEETAEDEEEMN